MVRQARSEEPGQALEALHTLCVQYQRAIHAWFQRSRPHWIPPARAEEWAQDFLLFMQDKNPFRRLERRESRFRSFLVSCLKNFFKDKLDAERAAKRGGELARDHERASKFFTSQLRFTAIAGTQYPIAIDGFAGAEGAFVLSWELEPIADELPLVICDAAPDGMGSQIKFASTAGIDYRVRAEGVQARQGVIRINAQLGHAPVLSTTIPTLPPAEFGQPLVLPAPLLQSNSGASLFYQWQLDGRDIPGATSNVYAVAALQASDAGQYSVRLRNEFDQVVHTFPPITLHVTYLNRAPRMINGALRLTVQRPLNQKLILEGSDDLQIWTPIHTVPITIPGPAVDLATTNMHRFYRAIPWP